MVTEAPDVQALAERLERLERDLRRWKRAGVALATVAILLAVVALLGQTQTVRTPVGANGVGVPQEVRAKRFVVVDADGKERVRLGFNSPGTALDSPTITMGLHVYGKDGAERATAGLDDNGPYLSLTGSKAYADLRVSEAHSRGDADLWLGKVPPTISLSDPEFLKKRHAEERYAHLWLDADKDEMGLRLGHPLVGGHNRAAELKVTPEGQWLGFDDDTGFQRMSLFLQRNGQPAVHLIDQHHKLRVNLWHTEDGSPSLELFGANGTPRAVLGTANLETIRTGASTRLPESSLTLFDKDGNVLWQAP